MLHFIDRQFRRPSGMLGTIISGIMKRGNKSIYDDVIPVLNITPHEHILEIGYGHGLGIDAIASNYDCAVTGIDFSELMFKEALKRNKTHIEAHTVDLYYGDFLDYDFGTNTYDKAYCINVIYFWDTLEKPFAKIKSVLKSGGSFSLYMVDWEHLKRSIAKGPIFNLHTIHQVVAALEQTGFSQIQYRKRNSGYIVQCKNGAL